MRIFKKTFNILEIGNNQNYQTLEKELRNFLESQNNSKHKKQKPKEWIIVNPNLNWNEGEMQLVPKSELEEIIKSGDIKDDYKDFALIALSSLLMIITFIVSLSTFFWGCNHKELKELKK